MTVYANVLNGVIPGETWSFTLHTSNVGGTIAAANAAWVTACTLLWDGAAPPADSIGQMLDVATHTTEADTASLDPGTGKQVNRVSTPLVLAGSAATNQLPPQISVGVSLRTALATRAGRGRFYLPVMTVTQVLTGKLVAADQTKIATAAQKMLQSLATAGYVPIIYHRATRTFDPVVSVDVGDVFDTQRRRRDKLVETRVRLNL